MRCAECDKTIQDNPLQLVQDYLCPTCRAALEPELWDERDRVTRAILEWLRSEGKIYHGYEVLFPEGSPWAWVKLYPEAEMVQTMTGQNHYDARTYDHYLGRMQLPNYVVFKNTGKVYELDSAGAVMDDPIFTPSWA